MPSIGSRSAETRSSRGGWRHRRADVGLRLVAQELVEECIGETPRIERIALPGSRTVSSIQLTKFGISAVLQVEARPFAAVLRVDLVAARIVLVITGSMCPCQGALVVCGRSRSGRRCRRTGCPAVLMPGRAQAFFVFEHQVGGAQAPS